MTSNQHSKWDLVVVGAGSGGIGATLAAARMGLRVLLVERGSEIGGNAVHGGVNVWEPGVGGTGLPFDIYERLKKIPQAVGIYSIDRHCCWPDRNDPPFPGGQSIIDPGRAYEDSLRRHGSQGLLKDAEFVQEHWHGVVFEPDRYVEVVRQMMEETGNIEVRTGTAFSGFECKDGILTSMTLTDGTQVLSDFWVDATNTGIVCRSCGAETLPKGDVPLNAVTLIFRVSQISLPQVEPLDGGIPTECWWQDNFPYMSCVQYPNGDLNCNMLPTMSGEECLELGLEAAYEECKRRVLAYWNWLQREFPEFQSYRISWMAPRIGVRETVHLVCDYMLDTEELLGGLSGQKHPDLIAIADHALDRHGADSKGCAELAQPYGIPLRCLLPKGLGNVSIASMAAGFTAEAATSCRLSRTIMQMGYAAGTAAALAAKRQVSIREILPFLPEHGEKGEITLY